MTTKFIATIRTIGNRALYRDLYEGIDSETTHRTATGAARRLLQITRQSKEWEKNVGKWGGIEIIINGDAWDGADAEWLMYTIEADKLSESEIATKLDRLA